MTTPAQTLPATAAQAPAPAQTKALDDVYRPDPWEGERAPHMAQCLANLYGCLEHFAWHLRLARQTGENEAVRSFLDEVDPKVEEVARAVAAKFAESYPDLQPLLPELAGEKSFVPFTKAVEPKQEAPATARKSAGRLRLKAKE